MHSSRFEKCFGIPLFYVFSKFKIGIIKELQIISEISKTVLLFSQFKQQLKSRCVISFWRTIFESKQKKKDKKVIQTFSVLKFFSLTKYSRQQMKGFQSITKFEFKIKIGKLFPFSLQYLFVQKFRNFTLYDF